MMLSEWALISRRNESSRMGSPRRSGSVIASPFRKIVIAFA